MLRSRRTEGFDAVTIGEEHERVLASLFSPSVAVACLDATSAAPHASFAEDPRFKQAAPARQLEFAGGRECARRVLIALGREPVPIAQGADGEPLWPHGVVGSISHAERLCTAVGARASDVRAIGVDIEPDRSESTAFARRVCREPELSAIGRLGASVEQLAPVVFAAKEASYKLQFPLTRDAGAWGSLEVLLAADTFTVRFDGAHGPLSSSCVQGRWRRALGFIWAGVAWSR